MRRARRPLFTTPKFLRGASKAAGVGAPEQAGKGGQAADSKPGEEAADSKGGEEAAAKQKAKSVVDFMRERLEQQAREGRGRVEYP